MDKYIVRCLADKPTTKVGMYHHKAFNSFIKACWEVHKLKKMDAYKVVLEYCKDSRNSNG